MIKKTWTSGEIDNGFILEIYEDKTGKYFLFKKKQKGVTVDMKIKRVNLTTKLKEA